MKCLLGAKLPKNPLSGAAEFMIGMLRPYDGITDPTSSFPPIKFVETIGLVLTSSPDLARILTEGLHLYLGYTFNYKSDQRRNNGRPKGQVPRLVRTPARTDKRILSS